MLHRGWRRWEFNDLRESIRRYMGWGGAIVTFWSIFEIKKHRKFDNLSYEYEFGDVLGLVHFMRGC